MRTILCNAFCRCTCFSLFLSFFCMVFDSYILFTLFLSFFFVCFFTFFLFFFNLLFLPTFHSPIVVFMFIYLFLIWTFHSGKSSFWSPSMICISLKQCFILKSSDGCLSLHSEHSWHLSQVVGVGPLEHVIKEPLLFISVAYIAFQLTYVHITVHSIHMPQDGFEPPLAERNNLLNKKVDARTN